MYPPPQPHPLPPSPKLTAPLAQGGNVEMSAQKPVFAPTTIGGFDVAARVRNATTLCMQICPMLRSLPRPASAPYVHAAPPNPTTPASLIPLTRSAPAAPPAQ